jgi:8-oxo-dGTP diphosphatase
VGGGEKVFLWRWTRRIKPAHLGLEGARRKAACGLSQRRFKWPPMLLPYRISTLLYCFNGAGQVLLMRRAREPNRGLWSPCGGKLKTRCGESPYACACREAGEEIGLALRPTDLHLTGLVSEHGYQGQAHWLMFLFEVLPRLSVVPPPHAEGAFRFFPRAALERLPLPPTDRDQIWPWFWRHRAGFFAAHCHCHRDGRYEWMLEESRPGREPEVQRPKGRVHRSPGRTSDLTAPR